jgi:hypothetical protein
VVRRASNRANAIAVEEAEAAAARKQQRGLEARLTQLLHLCQPGHTHAAAAAADPIVVDIADPALKTQCLALLAWQGEFSWSRRCKALAFYVQARGLG